MGVKSKTIHSLSQALGTGVVFLELQLKEYTAAFLTFRDSIFGSIHHQNSSLKFIVKNIDTLLYFIVVLSNMKN